MRSAIVAMLAVLASFGILYSLSELAGAGIGAAILAAVLAVSFARRPAASGAAVREFLLTLPLVALAATLVGWFLLTYPAIGAALFVSGMFLSIWLRRFGERERRIGAAIAMPLVAILVVPSAPHARGGLVVDMALVMLAGVAAVTSVELVRRVALRMGFLPKSALQAELPRIERASAAGKLPASTRLALQMAAALGAAFLVGMLFFPHYWPWVVLTAFIVCSGARGRGDVAYKSLMRVAGALAGAFLALLLARVAPLDGVPAACAIFAILFLGIYLREFNYAYWAGCLTLIFALLQAGEGGAGWTLLEMRLECIVVGAVCGVAASWFIFPIRTEAVVRRALADALAALQDLVSGDELTREERRLKLLVFTRRAKEIDRVAPPLELHHRLFGRAATEEHPAEWIAALRRLAARVEGAAIETIEHKRGALAAATGTCRRAIGKHSHPPESRGPSIGATLQQLHDTLPE